MKWFYNLKISAKLIVGFMVVAVIAAVLGIIGIVQLKTTAQKATNIYQGYGVVTGDIGQASIVFQESRSTLRDLIINIHSNDKQKYINQISEQTQKFNQYMTNYEKGIISQHDRDEYNKLKEMVARYRPARDKLVSFALASQDTEQAWYMLETDVAPFANPVREQIAKMMEYDIDTGKQEAEIQSKNVDNTVIELTVLVIVAVLMAVALGFWISRIISRPITKLVTMVDHLAKGDLDIQVDIHQRDEIGLMADSFQQMVANIKAMVIDANMLAHAAVEGKLATRADASKHHGDYRKIVEGVNQTLDAVIIPLNVAADYVDKISRGALPEKITDSYNGDFNVIKNNLNNCIDNITMLVADANMLAHAAVEGKLATRADASKHHGDYRKIVEGVNQTLDAVIAPINEVASVMQEMAQGNLRLSVTGNYQGDLAQLKDEVNRTVANQERLVGEISRHLTEIAQGNINLDKVKTYAGDFKPVSDALNVIIDELNEVLGEIRNAAEQVASGSRQVSDGSQALSQGATEQASSIEELTASITEIASQTKQNATNAGQANELAISAKDNAQQGNERMKQMLSSMVEINDSSANISKIIKVIDEIAFQTNILALNAAVEAARAGQHGKGFAVVAEEVRNLAGRSANAAKETTSLIEGSIKKVEIGTKIANDTAEALVMIVEGVEKAANLVGEIASASNEQATGIAQINKGIEQVSQVVQTNSATAEESAAASEELSGQSELLKDMIGRFTLKRMAKSNYERVDNSDTDTVKRKNSGGADVRVAKTEAAATNSKPRIALSDQEFGKYSS